MSKLFKIEIPRKEKKLPGNICHIKFCNKALELINLSEIFHYGNVEAEAHKISTKLVTPNLGSELVSPIRSVNISSHTKI